LGGTNVKDEFLHDFVQKVFAANRSIRFICITDQKGKVLGTSYRKDVMRQMSDEELEQYTRPWVMQMLMNDLFENITGELRYFLGFYNRLYTATIPVVFNRKDRLFVILSFDISDADPRLLVEEKILPLIGENRDFFI
jgi:hypothetical protein